MRDLSQHHELLSSLFSSDPTVATELTPRQLRDFEKDGFVVGPSVLNTDQLEGLRTELAEFTPPDHVGRELWYEYHTNESSDPDTVLFHALGAWRIRSGFHDILWHPAFTGPVSRRTTLPSGSVTVRSTVGDSSRSSSRSSSHDG